MASIFDLPAETLATVFEIGVHAWGTGYLHHVSLVCSDWHFITKSHPHLWGILDIGRGLAPSRSTKLIHQLACAKEAPLDITCHTSTNAFSKSKTLMGNLKNLRHNFVRLQVPVRFLLETDYNCNDICNGLQVLDLQWGGQNPESDVSKFFDEAEKRSRPKLYSFTAHSLPPSWVTPFLSRSITHFRLHKTSNRRPSHISSTSPISQTLRYLSRIPNVISLELEDLDVYRPPSGGHLPAHDSSLKVPLPKVQNLELTNVAYKGAILYAIQAPSLLSLIIRKPTQRRGDTNYYWHGGWAFSPRRDQDVEHSYGSLIPFFVEWSDPQRTPTNLHTLELTNVLVADEIPILIQWLHRLPNLVRLIINVEDEYSTAAGSLLDGPEPSSLSDTQADSNLFYALSHLVVNSSTGDSEWLCPLLTVLHLGDVDITAANVMSIARARGRTTSDTPVPLVATRPGHLHRFTTQLCACLSEEEREELHSLIKEASCTCLKCDFQSPS